MEAGSSSSNPPLGAKKKNKRKKGSKPRLEEIAEPGKETLYSGDDPRGYGLVDEQPPPYSYTDPLPSAPPLPAPLAPPPADIRLSTPEDPILLGKKKLIRSSYGVLAGQWTLFSGLTLLLVEIPHLRKIVRRNFFDKLFLTSSFGFPLAIVMVILLAIPSLRRKFAWATLLILTISLSLLMAYVITTESALAMFYTSLGADVSCLSVIGSTLIPRFDISSSSALLGIPLVMLSSSAAFSSLTHVPVAKWLPTSSVVTLLMCHIAYNTRSIFKENRLDLRPDEYAFAASNLYFNFDIKKWIQSYRRRREYRPIPEI